MKPARFSSHASASVSHELMEGVLSAVTAAKVADQNVVTALRARFASAPVTTRHEQPLRHSERALLSLWEAIVGMSHGDHGVGALLALHADDSAWGVAGEVLRQTPTLLDAYAQIERYSRLVHQGVTITIELSPSDIILRYRHTKNSPEQATGALAAGVLWAVSNLALVPMRWFDVSIRPIATALSCTAPAHMDPVTNVFGPSVSFNAAHPLLVYDRAEVEKACRPADTRILACLGALAERELDELPLWKISKQLSLSNCRAVSLVGLRRSMWLPVHSAYRCAHSSAVLPMRGQPSQ